MVRIQTALRVAAATVAALALLTIGAALDGRVEAQSQGNGLTGTWYARAGNVTGFYTYNQDGTVTGVFTTIHGTGYQPTPGNLHSTDHGVWSQVGGGYEAVVFRMAFDPFTGDALGITRIRMFFEQDRFDHDKTSGTFGVAQWACPTGNTCPDPNIDDPDSPEFYPPGEWTQTRVRLP